MTEARGARTLRQVEEDTDALGLKVNRETWRTYEIGRPEDPALSIMDVASQLPDAPSLDDFIVAAREDRATLNGTPRKRKPEAATA